MVRTLGLILLFTFAAAPIARADWATHITGEVVAIEQDHFRIESSDSVYWVKRADLPEGLKRRLEDPSHRFDGAVPKESLVKRSPFRAGNPVARAIASQARHDLLSCSPAFEIRSYESDPRENSRKLLWIHSSDRDLSAIDDDGMLTLMVAYQLACQKTAVEDMAREAIGRLAAYDREHSNWDPEKQQPEWEAARKLQAELAGKASFTGTELAAIGEFLAAHAADHSYVVDGEYRELIARDSGNPLSAIARFDLRAPARPAHACATPANATAQAEAVKPIAR